MTGDPQDIEALAEAIVARLPKPGPSVPLEFALWDIEDVAVFLKVSRRQAAERYAPLPEFPRAIRLPTADGRRSYPRWKAEEVIAWANKHQDKRRAA